jgi:hypothetical protein
VITARALVRVGACLVNLGRNEEAIEPLQRGLAIREKALGPEHPEVAEAKGLLAGATPASGSRRATGRAGPI